MAHSDTTMADALKEYANTPIPTSDIAAKYGVSASTLTVWARKSKIALRGRGRDKMSQPDARTREILETSETLTLEETGERFGMSKQRVQKIVRRWADWQRPKQSPFVPDDVVQWKGKLYTVLEGGPLFGKVRDDRGVTIHNFYWNMHGGQAVKVDAKTQATLNKKKAKKSANRK